jgi:hypothetical protein
VCNDNEDRKIHVLSSVDFKTGSKRSGKIFSKNDTLREQEGDGTLKLRYIFDKLSGLRMIATRAGLCLRTRFSVSGVETSVSVREV